MSLPTALELKELCRTPADTATVSVSAVSVLIQTVLADELKQMGYTVDGTTTPGSFIITW